MNYVTSNQNVSIPCMLYGTAWKKERTADLVALALQSGFRGIDTACQPKHYEEALVGEGCERFYAKGGTREELYLQTKFTPYDGQDPLKIPYDPHTSLEEQIITSCEMSKHNLQTSYLDSLLLHSPLFPYNNLLKAWNVFESLFEEGEVRQIGISNCYDLSLLQTFYEHVRIKPSVVQNRFYADVHYDKTLRSWANEKGIIYQSFWTLSANPHILHSPPMREIVNIYGKSAEQIFYRYVIQKGIVPLNGTTSALHMKEDLSIFEFSLDEKDVERIDALL
ncbi:aldo-keto reductase family protein [Sulfurospirillum diekertiae]|uniref:Aldo-keto reductase family protein n=1 Tax=Sulfurospirillum diekertiae TaxID=1854492 RepID=A0A290HSE3_9BACT|nr:aldo/keto reductase [Sulfurospirillum diekertiae]ATB68570.1 aldo-keto reductase family protein [Sulfurospirillum diekertiae]